MNRLDSLRRARFELGALLITVVVFWIAENVLGQKIPALIILAALWAIHLGRVARQDRDAWRRWGLRPPSPRAAWGTAAGVLVAGGALLLLYRLLAGWQPLPGRSIWIFLGYPVWSLVQQLVLQGILVSDLEQLGVRRWALVILGSLGFGLAHLPDLELAGLCALAGGPWTLLFLSQRGLVPIAITHAVLGTLTFYWVLERDPLAEFGYA